MDSLSPAPTGAAGADGAEGSVIIHADAHLYAGLLDGSESATLALNPERKSYVHLIRGALEVNGTALNTGDALLVENEAQLTLCNASNAEVLVFDLAA